MKRGELYRVSNPAGDSKSHRTFVVVSRQTLIDTRYPWVICAPVFTEGQGLSTQVNVGIQEGLKHDSWIHCDNLRSLQKHELTRWVGSLSPEKMRKLNFALTVALELPFSRQ